MSITQFMFGLVSGAVLAGLGLLGMTEAIIDSSLMVVGVALCLVNVGFWMMQERRSPELIKVRVSDAQTHSAARPSSDSRY